MNVFNGFDTSFITSLKMMAAGGMQFFLVDEKDKPQQSMTINDTGSIISGHGITRALICDRLQLFIRRETLVL